MKEGWVRDDYLILFDESEVATVTDRCALAIKSWGFAAGTTSSFVIRKEKLFPFQLFPYTHNISRRISFPRVWRISVQMHDSLAG